MKKKNFRKLFAVLIAACMMVLCVPVTSQATVRVSAPRLKTARSTSSGMYLNWTRISNASGYVIYRNNKCIGGVKGSRSLAYLDKKAKTGSRYTYSVRAFRQYGKKRVYSNASNRIQGVRKAVSNNGLGTPVQSGVRFWKNLSATGGNGVTYGTTWNKIKGAAGYQVQIRGYEYLFKIYQKKQLRRKLFQLRQNWNENKSLQNRRWKERIWSIQQMVLQ